MLTRMLQAKIEKINQTDSEQATDISGLKTDVGEVTSGEGNDLQSQVTALGVRVKALEDAAETTAET